MDQREDLHRITAPTLVLAGAEDLAIPPDHSERLVEGVPKSRLALVHGAHLATLEAATESTALLLDHLLPGEGGL
jgi:3-oxoadipate enol-lactonase